MYLHCFGTPCNKQGNFVRLAIMTWPDWHHDPQVNWSPLTTFETCDPLYLIRVMTRTDSVDWSPLFNCSPSCRLGPSTNQFCDLGFDLKRQNGYIELLSDLASGCKVIVSFWGWSKYKARHIESNLCTAENLHTGRTKDKRVWANFHFCRYVFENIKSNGKSRFFHWNILSVLSKSTFGKLLKCGRHLPLKSSISRAPIISVWPRLQLSSQFGQDCPYYLSLAKIAAKPNQIR